MVEPVPPGGQADGPTTQGPPEGLIAGLDRLESFCSLPAPQRPPLDAPLRGVLAETALTGLQRYEWRLLAPLLHSLVDAVLADYARQEAEVEGPPRPPPPGFESAEAVGARLHALVDGFDSAPFTLQRLCEVLLEPRKQYARLDKVVVAIEKLLMVTSTRQPDGQMPPPPTLGMLDGVNSNPKSPYLDGRPPQVLDPQQHQALLQQQAQAMAAVQQQHMRQQQQQRQPGGGLPNGLDDEGPPPLKAVNGQPGGAAAAAAAAEAAAAVAAAEAMRMQEAAAFVESALADPNGGGAAGSSGSEGSPRRAAPEEAAAGSVPPTPPGQQPVSPPPGGAAAEQQQQHEGQQGLNGGAAAVSGSEQGPASMDVDMAEAQPAAVQEGPPGATDAQQLAAAAAAAEQPQVPHLAARLEPQAAEAGPPAAEMAAAPAPPDEQQQLQRPS